MKKTVNKVLICSALIFLGVIFFPIIVLGGIDENLEKDRSVAKQDLTIDIDLTWKENGSVTSSPAGVTESRDFIYREAATVQTRIYKIPRFYGGKPGFSIAEERFKFKKMGLSANYTNSMFGQYPEITTGEPGESSVAGGGDMKSLNLVITQGTYTVMLKNSANWAEFSFVPGGSQNEVGHPVTVNDISYPELQRTGAVTKTFHEQKVIPVPVGGGSGSFTYSVDGTIKVALKQGGK